MARQTITTEHYLDAATVVRDGYDAESKALDRLMDEHFPKLYERAKQGWKVHPERHTITAFPQTMLTSTGNLLRFETEMVDAAEEEHARILFDPEWYNRGTPCPKT